METKLTKFSLMFWILVISILIPACTTNKTKDNNVWLANPASVYCEENWWTLELVFESEGMMWICNFPDWSSCEERAYYRGGCTNETEDDQLENENIEKNDEKNDEDIDENINEELNYTWAQVDVDKLLEKCEPGGTWLTEWDIECMEDIIDHYLPQ
jgi:putative hemolysin